MRREEIVEESDSTDNPSINGRYHRFNVKLGKGAFKEVYKAFDTHEQIDVAWNSIDLSLINTEDEKKKIFKECEMLRRLNHTNILKITNQWFNEKTDKLCFITNIVHDGSLSKFFRKRQVNLLRVKQICKQILNALLYLHSMGVIHRDLKCDNIFIEGNTGKVVLGDLGLSCNVVSARSIVGTPHWMAPELYREDYNEMVDIWSFGMCVLELITSLIPYSECKGAFQVYQHISAGKKPESLKKLNDPYVRAFINICLNVNPSQRPSARELLDHPFLYRKPQDTTLCSQLMLPKKDQKEPPRTMEEKIEEKQLENTLTDNNNNKTHHDFHCERANSPAPPTSATQQLTATQNNVNTTGDEKRTQRKKKKEKVDIKFVKNNGDTIRIKLQITCSKFKKPMNVEFDFCHTQEQPASVALEMVRDLGLQSKFTAKVEKAIKNAVAEAKQTKPSQPKPTQPLKPTEASTANDNKNNKPLEEVSPPVPLSETKSRKSLGADFQMTFLQNSPNMEPGAPDTQNLNANALQTSTTSLTPEADSANSPPHKAVPVSNKKDPMYSKPTPMSERMFGFSQNESQPQTDYLTSDPPQQIMSNYNMPMVVRNVTNSPDPPLAISEYAIKHRESLSHSNHSNTHDDISSIGSVPQPHTASNSQIFSAVTEPPHVLAPSQSLPHGGAINAVNGAQRVIFGAYSGNKAQSVPNRVPSPQTSPKIGSVGPLGGNRDLTNMQRSISQPTKQMAKVTDVNGVMPKLPPIPDAAFSVSAQKYNRMVNVQHVQHRHSATHHIAHIAQNKHNNVNNNNQATGRRNISPPKSTTPPTPPPVIGIQGHDTQKKQETKATNNNHRNNRNGYVHNNHHHHPRSHSITILGTSNGTAFNYNPQPRSRSASPGPQYILNGDADLVKKDKNVKFTEKEIKDRDKESNDKSGENKENVTVPQLSTGLLALQSLSSKSTDKEVFRATLKLTEDELIEEFVKRSKKYDKSAGKTGLARKLVNVLIEGFKNESKDEESDKKKEKENTASPISVAAQLELPKKEQSPDSVFSAKSASIESMVSIETAEQLMKKGDSRRDSVLKLKDYDSGTSSHDYDIYTNNQKASHKHSATTIIHHSNAYKAALGDKKGIKTSKSAHTLAPNGGYKPNHNYNHSHNPHPHIHHNGGHVSQYSSASNLSTVSTMTMGTMQSIGNTSMATMITMDSSALSMGFPDNKETDVESSLPTVASLQLPFDIEELKLPSPSTGIVFDDDVLSQISKKQMELHLEYIEFVKRKYELLQLRYRTLEEEFHDMQQQNEKLQEENNIKEKINNKRSELTDKFGEWLSDREQIALLKQRIEKKRSTSMDKLPTFDLQLEFENDPQFIQLMQSQLSDADKRECKLQIYSFRKEMMNEYKNFYFKTIQIYKDKVKQMHH